MCVCVCVCVKGGEGSQVQFGLQKNFCISAVLCLPDRKMSRTALQFLRSFSNRFSLLCSCLAVLTVSAVCSVYGLLSVDKAPPLGRNTSQGNMVSCDIISRQFRYKSAEHGIDSAVDFSDYVVLCSLYCAGPGRFEEFLHHTPERPSDE